MAASTSALTPVDQGWLKVLHALTDMKVLPDAPLSDVVNVETQIIGLMQNQQAGQQAIAGGPEEQGEMGMSGMGAMGGGGMGGDMGGAGGGAPGLGAPMASGLPSGPIPGFPSGALPAPPSNPPAPTSARGPLPNPPTAGAVDELRRVLNQ